MDSSLAPHAQCCGQCGAAFSCGMQAGVEPCWCASLPRLTPPIGSTTDCLCPDCLSEAARQQGNEMRKGVN
ncbi:MAG: cysteine-rich CWC family protein [Burkholderiales bacterium]